MMDDERSLEAAFTAIYDEHSRAVYRHCYFRLLDEQAAQDVLQETFIRFWTYLSRGNAVENNRAFLYTTANRIIVDLARQRRRRPTMSLEVLTETGHELGGPHLQEDLAAEEEHLELRETLGSLQEPYRALLVMRYLDGFSVAEIARITGRSAAVVSVQLYRGTRKLRSLLRHG